MVNKLTKIIVAMLFLISMPAHSLSVGEIKLYSFLNQKLNSEISLILNAGESIDDIKVDMATADEFNKLGIDRDYFISKIKLQPIVKANGETVIKITSEQVLQEPILNFLVKVNWSNGELYKEFTVLINPPAYQKPDTRVLTAPLLPPKKIAQSSDSATKIQNDLSHLETPKEYGPPNKGDSLWSIAKKVNRHDDVSVTQMLMALYKANPTAFYQQNINALMRERVLKIPDKSAILKLSKEQARQQFYKQMASWESKTVEPVEALKSEIEPEIAIKTIEKTTDNSKLTLIPPSEYVITQTIALANNNKKIEKVISENLQLQQRLDNLEKKFTMLQKTMAIKEQQFEAMQKQQLVKKTIPAMQQTTVDKQPIANDSSVNYFYLLGTGVVILLGFGYLLSRKLQAKQGINKINILPTTDELQDKISTPASPEKASHNADTVDKSSFLSDITSGDSNVSSTNQSEVDPSLGADVYLTHEQYQQAEALMRQAIKDEPNKDAYQLKLLEVFYASKNKTDFEQYANKLATAGKQADINFWGKVAEMGSQLIPDSDLFANDYKKSEATGIIAGNIKSAIPLEEANHQVAEDNTSNEIESLDFDLSKFEASDIDDIKLADDLKAFGFSGDSMETATASSEQTKTTNPTENDDFVLDLDYNITDPQKAEAVDQLDSEVADLTETDAVETKIDLAKAYIAMGDLDAAKMLAQEALELGNDAQKLEAKAIINSLNK